MRKIGDYLCGRDEEIARLDVHGGREVTITAGVCWEISRPIYYHITESGRIVVPKTYIGGDGGDDEHQYSKIFAERESLIGILETTSGKQTLVVMQDFRNGESWPRINDQEVPYEEKVIRRQLNLFDRLLKEHPSLQRPDELGDPPAVPRL